MKKIIITQLLITIILLAMLQQVNSGIKGKMKTMLRKAKNKIKFKKHKFVDSRDQFSEKSGSDYFYDCPESENESMEDNLLKCKVCWDGVPLEQLCFCDRSMRVQSEGNSGEEDNANANANNKSGEIHQETTHAFCSQCLEQYTNTAHQEMPFAKGGLGLRCMVPKCNNPITWQEIRAFVPSKLTRSLEDRCAELIVSQSKLSFLERCRKCNCAVEMGISPEEQLIFCCPECTSKFCRKCNEAWVDEHNGISCEQFATKQKRQQRQHNLDELLTAVAVHKCHECKSSFIKRSGCNHVTCTCGASVCSICWTTDVPHNHFCECFFPPRLLGRCENCGKCLVWYNAKENEEREMERIRKESDAGASVSQQI